MLKVERRQKDDGEAKEIAAACNANAAPCGVCTGKTYVFVLLTENTVPGAGATSSWIY